MGLPDKQGRYRTGTEHQFLELFPEQKSYLAVSSQELNQVDVINSFPSKSTSVEMTHKV